MTWQHKLICSILLIIAKMVADPQLREELQRLDNAIQHGRLGEAGK